MSRDVKHINEGVKYENYNTNPKNQSQTELSTSKFELSIIMNPVILQLNKDINRKLTITATVDDIHTMP